MAKYKIYIKYEVTQFSSENENKKTFVCTGVVEYCSVCCIFF